MIGSTTNLTGQAEDLRTGSQEGRDSGGAQSRRTLQWLKGLLGAFRRARATGPRRPAELLLCHSVGMPEPAGEGSDFERALEQLDTRLLDQLPAQLEQDDRRSLLALHQACRHVRGTFSYLEIGSHLGGSLQALVRDPACTAIASIDSRPDWQPDERGAEFAYPENSTARMLALLAEVPGAAPDKVQTYDVSTADLDPGQLRLTPQLCLVDGEHTDQAAVRDAHFCRTVMQDGGCIAFHDAAIVYRGISRFVHDLEQMEAEFCAYVLPDSVFVVELGEVALRDTEWVTGRILENYRGYLYSLEVNEPYRTHYNRPVFRAARRLRTFLRPNGIFR